MPCFLRVHVTRCAYVWLHVWLLAHKYSWGQEKNWCVCVTVCLCVHALPWIVLHGNLLPHGKRAKESPRTSLTLSQGCGKCLHPKQLGVLKKGVGRRKEKARRKRGVGISVEIFYLWENNQEPNNFEIVWSLQRLFRTNKRSPKWYLYIQPKH